jgi:glucosamine kinase
MIIAEVGGTKSQWFVMDSGEHKFTFNLKGMNVTTTDPAHFEQFIEKEVAPLIYSTFVPVQCIVYYGAGVTGTGKTLAEGLLGKFWPSADITVHNDSMAAVHGLCGKEAGFAAILGTGANCVFFDGKEVTVSQNTGVGYILGDEGSGSYLGKKLLKIFIMGDLASDLEEPFKEMHGNLTYSDVIRIVYCEGNPSGNLALFARFVIENGDHPQMNKLIMKGFRTFFRLNFEKCFVSQKGYPVHFVGGVAFAARKYLDVAAKEYGLTIGKVVPNLQDCLLSYHKDGSYFQNGISNISRFSFPGSLDDEKIFVDSVADMSETAEQRLSRYFNGMGAFTLFPNKRSLYISSSTKVSMKEEPAMFCSSKQIPKDKKIE